MTAKKTVDNDIDVIVPDEGTLIIDGINVTVKRLRAREAMMLIGVMTKGLGPNLALIDFDAEDKESQGLALLMMAVPQAMDEALQFLQVVVQPVYPEDAGALRTAMRNPEIETFMDVCAILVDQEWDEFRGLMGKATALWSQMKKSHLTGR